MFSADAGRVAASSVQAPDQEVAEHRFFRRLQHIALHMRSRAATVIDAVAVVVARPRHIDELPE
jgi:hypothetical protein